jgi:regulator of cell morphogenesis and NO signaling
VDDLDLDTSAADWAVEHPAATRLFEELGIDYSCAGKSLGYVCRQRGLDPHAVLTQLRRALEDRDSQADVAQ